MNDLIGLPLDDVKSFVEFRFVIADMPDNFEPGANRGERIAKLVRERR